MTYLTDTPARSRQSPAFDFSALDRVDRLLLGGCVAAWLAALGAGVAATVALVDLSRGPTASSSESGTPWFLYTVIGVSAVVIVAAVPLLLRARRASVGDPTPGQPAHSAAPPPQAPARGAEAPTEKFRAPAVTAEPSGPIPRMREQTTAEAAAVGQVWLRCAAGIGCAMGVATLLTAVSTYLMAVDSDTVAWVLLGVAVVVTVAMVAIPWYSLRELRAIAD